VGKLVVQFQDSTPVIQYVVTREPVLTA
jgi:hypothetical protein